MNKNRIYYAILSLILAVLVCFSAVSCTLITSTSTTTTTTTTTTTDLPPDVEAPFYEDGESEGLTFSTLHLIDILFQSLSLRDYDKEEALISAIRAYILATGDKYATYYTPEELEDNVAENSGDLYGIGVTVIFDYKTLDLEIVSIVPDSPASKHLLLGDRVIEFYNGEEFVKIVDLVDEYKDKYREIYNDEELIHKNAADDAYHETIAAIKGEEGTHAKFRIVRDGQILEMEIERAKVKTISVNYRRSQKEPSVGIVTIDSFNLTTPIQFEEAMDALIAQGVKKFVFDVRNNPGGDLASIVAVMSTFLNEGDTILSTKDVNGHTSVTKVRPISYEAPEPGEGDYRTCNVTADQIGKYRGYEMVVLTNGKTASAAELFTAALRDYELAKIVGVKTFGKGSMQSTIPLSYYGENYLGALKLTTKLYFPPCGIGYDGEIGIEPDYPVELSEEAAAVHFYKLTEDIDNQLQKAISLLVD